MVVKGPDRRGAGAAKRTDYAWAELQRQASRLICRKSYYVATRLAADARFPSRPRVKRGRGRSEEGLGVARSACHLVEEIRAAADKEAEQGHAHCHCEVHGCLLRRISVRKRTILRIIPTRSLRQNSGFPDEGFHACESGAQSACQAPGAPPLSTDQACP